MGEEKIEIPDYFQTSQHRWGQWLTYKCNFACDYCIMSHRDAPGGTPRWKPKELTAAQIISYWNNIDHPEGKHLGLIGGEPTLHRGFAEIVQNLEGYALTVTSNVGSTFFKDPNFTDKLKTKPNSTLRMNTSFHPDFITPEKYLESVYKMASAGIWVEQTSFVYTPVAWKKWSKEIEHVNHGIKEMGGRGLYPDVYLGFWNQEDGFDATTSPTNLWPRGDHDVEDFRRAHVGIDDWDQFRDATGATEKSYIDHCSFAKEKMLVAPNGDVFACHYKLYHGIDPMYNITNFKEPGVEQAKCGHYGYCLTCSFPQHSVSPKTKVVVNKLYNRNEMNIPEIESLSLELQDLAAEKNAVYNEKVLFESAMMYLYSGHRHYGDVLYYGDAKNALLAYLRDKKYKVHYGKLGLTTLKKKDKKADVIMMSDYRASCYEDGFLTSVAENVRKGGHIILSMNITTDKNSSGPQHVMTIADLYSNAINPLKGLGFVEQGDTNYYNVPLGAKESTPYESDCGFGIICMRKE